jgi:hypothetical protein
MKKITFTNITEVDLELPKPASAYIPEWYKNTPGYQGKKQNANDGIDTASTVKKCMPVFDAMTAGYIITTPADVMIYESETEAPYYRWSSFDLIHFHPVDQASMHPKVNGYPYPKWNSPWAIETPPGYSCLIVQPFHRESVFEIFPGIVDTDTYKSPINFPFVLKDPKMKGIIPAGTPIAQVIPFKRESWKSVDGGKQGKEKSLQTEFKLNTKFYNKYKSFFWNKKEYR